MDDKEIVRLFWKRDERALRETGAKYRVYCFGIARNILYDDWDAEETVNDALLGAWKSIPPHSPEILSAYMGKVTRYAALKKWRDRRASKRGGGEMPLALNELDECVTSDGPESALEEKELTRLINAFLRSLPETERNVFLMRYWYIASVQEIAARFSFTPGKVKTMLWRTRGKLKSYLEKEGVVI